MVVVTDMKKNFLRNVTVLVTAAAVLAATGLAKADPGLPELMDRETAKAIERGLNYLVRTQRQDGSWLNSGGYGTYPQVMTSLNSPNSSRPAANPTPPPTSFANC